MYYPCSENKGADQVRGHRKADLHLCFRICKKPVFSRRDSNDAADIIEYSQTGLLIISFSFGLK